MQEPRTIFLKRDIGDEVIAREVHRAERDGVPITFQGIGGRARKKTKSIYETFPDVYWYRDGRTWAAVVGRSRQTVIASRLRPSRRD